MISIPEFTVPSFPGIWSGAPTIGAGLSISVANDGSALIFQAPRTGTVYQIGYGLSAAGSSGLGNVTRSLESVTAATGFPTGTSLGGAAVVGLQAVGFNVVTLTSGASLTKGVWYAVVIKHTPATTQTWSVMSFDDSVIRSCIRKFTAATGLYTLAQSGQSPFVGVNYSNGGNDWGWPDEVEGPLHTNTSINISSSQTNDEIALKFQLPFAATLNGLTFACDMSIDAPITIYDSASSVLSTQSMYNTMPSTGSAYPIRAMLETPVNLAANTDYRAAVKWNGSTTSQVIYYWTAPSAALMAQFTLPVFHLSRRKSAGAWTDETTQRPWFFLHLSGIDDGVGSGGDRSSFHVG